MVTLPWAKARVGAVAAQSFVKVEYGPEGLLRMENGQSAQEALNGLISEDSGESVRQVAMIDVKAMMQHIELESVAMQLDI